MGANFNIGDFATGGGRLNPKTGEFNPNGLGNSSNLPQGYSFTDTNPFAIRAAVQPRDGFQFAYGPQGDRIEVSSNQFGQLNTNPINQSQVGYGNFPLTPNTGGGRNYSNAFDIQSGDSDYTKAAKVQAQGNLAAAQQTATANRVNQINPYGAVRYYQSGTDSAGNPVYSSASSLAPEQQQLLDIQNRQSLALGNIGNMMLSNVASTYGQPFNPNLPQVGINAGEQYQNAYMRRLQPQIEQGRSRLAQQLANQGIDIGSEAYDRAMRNQSMSENDLLAAATTQGFNTGLAANQQAYSQAFQNYGLPLATLNSLRQGSQVTNPTFMGVPQQGQVSGPDTLAAYQAQQNANIAAANRDAASRSNLTSGLFNLGGSVLGNLGGIGNAVGGIVGGIGNVASGIGNAVGRIFSDPRLKENIKAVGVMDNGLTLYSFEYKDEVKLHPMGGEGIHIGVMADEVEKVFPYAVSTLNDGYKVVDYTLLP